MRTEVPIVLGGTAFNVTRLRSQTRARAVKTEWHGSTTHPGANIVCIHLDSSKVCSTEYLAITSLAPSGVPGILKQPPLRIPLFAIPDHGHGVTTFFPTRQFGINARSVTHEIAINIQSCIQRVPSRNQFRQLFGTRYCRSATPIPSTVL